MSSSGFFNKGVYTVIPTVFSNNGVNFVEIFKLIDYQINNNVRNIVLLGTTSETPVLSNQEKVLIVSQVWEKYHNNVNIIVGIGGNNTEDVIEKAILFSNLSHGFLATVPNYNKPTQEGIYQHFSKIAESVPSVPIMLYNVPSRCGVSIDPIIVQRLYDNYSNIQAIKEASGSIDQIMKIKSLCNIMIFSGDDSLSLPVMSIGGSGVVSVASNLIPNTIVTMIEYCLDNSYDKARQLFSFLYPLFKCLFIETNPVPLKYLLMKKGMFSSDQVRLPLVKVNEYNASKLDEIYNVYLKDLKKNVINC